MLENIPYMEHMGWINNKDNHYYCIIITNTNDGKSLGYRLWIVDYWPLLFINPMISHHSPMIIIFAINHWLVVSNIGLVWGNDGDG